jgi:hypothetical protein
MNTSIFSTRLPQKAATMLRQRAIRERRTTSQMLRLIVEDFFDKPMRRTVEDPR